MEIREGIKYKTFRGDDGYVYKIDKDQVHVYFKNNPKDIANEFIEDVLETFKDKTLKLTYYPYKVGDYVIAKYTTSEFSINSLLKIEHINYSDYTLSKNGKTLNLKWQITNIRPAFSHEIPKETNNFIIGNWYSFDAYGAKNIARLNSIENSNFNATDWILNGFKRVVENYSWPIRNMFNIKEISYLEVANSYLIDKKVNNNFDNKNKMSSFEDEYERQERILQESLLGKKEAPTKKGGFNIDEYKSLVDPYKYYEIGVDPYNDNSEGKSTLDQIKKRSKIVNYKIVDLFNDWK